MSKSRKKQHLAHLEGIEDLMGDRYYQMQGFFEKSQEVAMYYGFEPIETPIIEHEDLFTLGIGEETELVSKQLYNLRSTGGDKLVLRPEFTAAVMRAYIQHNLKTKSQPVLFYSFGPVYRNEDPEAGRYRQHHQFDIEVLGSDKPVADAIVIQTALCILKECGAKDLVVNINSIGDQDSRASYEKELRNFYRKHLADLSAADRQLVKTNPLRVMDSKDSRTMTVNQEAPESICSLSSSSKKHFKKVLEHLDELEMDYQLNKNLMRGLDYYSETIFEISSPLQPDAQGDETSRLALCGGGRYDSLAKRIGHPKDIPGVGAAIGAERVLESEWWSKHQPRIIKDPSFYFIQVGFDAKLKSLEIVELLRKAKIPVHQSLSKDSVTKQLEAAEKTKVPYTLIFGQREALDGTVLVRDMKKRSQKAVKIDDLVKYLRKIK